MHRETINKIVKAISVLFKHLSASLRLFDFLYLRLPFLYVSVYVRSLRNALCSAVR